MTADLRWLTIAEAATLIAARKLSPVELIEASLRRIEGLDSHLNAFVTVIADRARQRARAAEAEIVAGDYRGPLHGVPIGLKDIYDTAGIRTTAGSRILIDHVPDRDATVASRLAESGAVLVGKLATHEFACGGPAFDLPWPPARNPWDRERFTGGSSSGCGAAVAAGLIPGAFGSDTGGSIRTPAALCGIAGFKPTYGLVSRSGVIPNSYSFDTCGPLARTVEDCAILLGATAAHDPRDPASVDRPIADYRAGFDGELRGLRIGVVRHFWEEDQRADADVATAMDRALEVLVGLGARIEEARTHPLQDYYDVKTVIADSELYASHERDLRTRLGDFGAELVARVLPACLFRAVDYVQAQRQRRRMLAEMKSLYARFDVLVTVGATAPAPRLDAYRMGSLWQTPNVVMPFNVTAGPALVVCNGFTDDGLPLSLQLAGRPFDDATVLKAGHAYERATPWRARRPDLAEGAAPVPLRPPAPPRTAADVDAETEEIVRACVIRARLRLGAPQFARLCQAAPHALAMARRLRRTRPWAEEPANVFRSS